MNFPWKIVLKLSYNKVKMSSAYHSPATQGEKKTTPPKNPISLVRKFSHRKGNFGQLSLMTKDKEIPGRFHGLQNVRHKGTENIFIFYVLHPFLYLPFHFSLAFYHIFLFLPLLFPTFLA